MTSYDQFLIPTSYNQKRLAKEIGDAKIEIRENRARAETARSETETLKNEAIAETEAIKTATEAVRQSAISETTELKNAAETARNDAIRAKEAAESAKSDAETAAGNAASSEVNAREAETNATAARGLAEAAKAAAETARDEAVAAKNASETARDASELAQSSAEQAKAESETARNEAVAARNNATTAKTAAEQAQSQAESARDDAEQSRTLAESAQNNAAQSALDAAAYAERAESSADTVTQAVSQAAAEAVAHIVADAPENFDTLKEMSDWIENHEDSASAMNTAIQGKVDKSEFEEYKSLHAETHADIAADIEDIYDKMVTKDGNKTETVTGLKVFENGISIGAKSSTFDDDDENGTNQIDRCIHFGDGNQGDYAYIQEFEDDSLKIHANNKIIIEGGDDGEEDESVSIRATNINIHANTNNDYDYGTLSLHGKQILANGKEIAAADGSNATAAGTSTALNKLPESTTKIDDNEYLVSTESASNTTQKRKKFSVLWDWIKGKLFSTDDTKISVVAKTTSTADAGTSTYAVRSGTTELGTFSVKNGSKGSTGANGTNGVSISSVTQTTTSTADAGENVVTVTLSNGTKSTFKVKNGSKGSTGDTGPQPSLSTSVPAANGRAAAGTSTTASRSDHVHPSKLFSFSTSTAAATRDKVLTLSGTTTEVTTSNFTIEDGIRFSVLFSSGNTYNSKSGDTVSAGPRFKIGTTYINIYVGNELAGANFVNSNELHDFELRKVNNEWRAYDKTATVIFKGGDASNGYYVKHRDGLYEDGIGARIKEYQGSTYLCTTNTSGYRYYLKIGTNGELIVEKRNTDNSIIADKTVFSF